MGALCVFFAGNVFSLLDNNSVDKFLSRVDVQTTMK